MSPFQRILIGSLFGAFFALLFYPKCNELIAPYFGRAFQASIVQDSEYLFTSKQGPSANSAPEQAYWIQRAAIERVNRRKITKADTDRLIKWCKTNSDLEIENAFWPMMQSVFETQLGNHKDARKSWILASNREIYDDYQSWRIRQVEAEILQKSGHMNSWNWSELYPIRSDAAFMLIQRNARTLQSLETDKVDLDLRKASLLNGTTLRRSSKSLQGGIIGTRICDLAAIQTKSQTLISVFETKRARSKFNEILLKDGRTEDSVLASRIFAENDSWNTVISSRSKYKELQTLRINSQLVALVPGAALWCLLSYFLLALLAAALAKFTVLQKIFMPIPALIVGAICCILVYLILNLTLPAIVMALSFAFFSFRPANVRKVAPETAELYIRVPLSVFNALMILCFFMLFSTLGIPGEQMKQLGNPVFTQFMGSLSLVGIILVTTGLSLMIAPLWSSRNKIDPGILSQWVIQWLSIRGVLASLFIFIVAMPISLWLDDLQTTQLQRIVLNEPNAYLSK